MDEGEELMRAADVLVQRGTNHAWSNRTNETELRRIITDAGYIPAQRDTLYRSYVLKQVQ